MFAEIHPIYLKTFLNCLVVYVMHNIKPISIKTKTKKYSLKPVKQYKKHMKESNTVIRGIHTLISEPHLLGQVKPGGKYKSSQDV